ncbi:alkylated DNA repair protein alkB homolog 8 isoform X1 [Pelobates fuscus]|uniref:alkylated DNA repair protein alkB homolog 8 isoform X1 n=2 Tax=Pelobates fuscus TaxID=191477 RepID=UPI002FE4D63F
MAACCKGLGLHHEMASKGEVKQKISKEEKKLMKKQAKVKHILLKHEGVETVSHPSKSLVIANGGLGNGVGRHQLLTVLEQCGKVESLVMPPNKPYSFVTYTSTDEAVNAYSSLSGHEISSNEWEQKITLYFSFVDKVELKEVLPPALPPGLVIVDEFVTAEEELAMLEGVDWMSDIANKKSLKHRRVKHYGYEFRYDNNNVDKDQPLPGGLPGFCTSVVERCLQQGLIKHKPDQLTVNQYEPGQGIPPHIDTHSAFEDEIISISLGSEIVMEFKHPNDSNVQVMLPQRSLLVMSGESRYLWTHGITPRKFDVVQDSEGKKVKTISGNIEELTLKKRGTRTSFTFRKVRRNACDCAFPSVCDSQQTQEKESAPQISVLGVEALEKEYVHKVYEDIAGHFSSTRHTPWPKVVDFLVTLPDGAIVADIGCGNGKYLGVNKNLYMIGCDRSKNLVNICGEKKFEASVCDALDVPFRTGSFDACLSIAVIHHFATEERRLRALMELTRLLRSGGKALIYVWAMEQEYNEKKSKYLKENKNNKEQKTLNIQDGGLKPDTNTALPVHTNRTTFESRDLLVPWHLKPSNRPNGTKQSNEEEQGPRSVYHRYYHVFHDGELEGLCRKLENITILQSYYDQGNWCVILEKS